MMKFIISIVCLFLLAFALIVLRTFITKEGRNISSLQNSVEIKEARNQYLKLEILRLSSPDRIENIGVNKLGMSIIEPQRIVILQTK